MNCFLQFLKGFVEFGVNVHTGRGRCKPYSIIELCNCIRLMVASKVEGCSHLSALAISERQLRLT